MALRALRGATTVDGDDPEQIAARTGRLITELMDRNGLTSDDLISIVFSVTPDLRSVAPAAAVRALGIVEVPLLCLQEMDVDGALPNCIRALIHIETDRPRSDLLHAYLEGATVLRPDLAARGHGHDGNDPGANPREEAE